MNQANPIRRRDFLRHAGVLTAAAAVGARPRRSHARLGANDKIIVGLIGHGGMGGHHLHNLLQRTDVQVAAVCDVYRPRAEAGAKLAGPGCQAVQDYRRVLDRPEIDAIFCATPDHWHALIGIHACQAWKDAYVEKPLTTSVAEGRKLVETARRYGRVVQVGIQQRSMEVFRRAIRLAHAGELGPLITTRAWIGPNGIAGPETPQDPPPDLDWEMWLGPAPWAPYSPQRFHGFRAFDDYAGGEMTNWGPHLIDIALWAMRQDAPLSVQGLGGTYRQISTTDHEVQDVIFAFPGCTLTWSQSVAEQHAGKPYGTMLTGSRGRLIINRESYVAEPAGLNIPEFKQPGEYFITVTEHHDNFFACMRSRQRPAADVEIGHRATSTCLIGNIAIDLRRKLDWDGATERFINDPQADRYLYRPYRAPWHL